MVIDFFMEIVMLDIKLMSDTELESISGGVGIIVPNGNFVSPAGNQADHALPALLPLIMKGTLDTPLTFVP